jgi:hypothetical protein
MLAWLVEAMRNLGLISSSVRLATVAGTVFAVSLVSAVVRRNRTSLLLALPILLAFVASVLQRYPWLPRLILFIVPLLVLIAALNAVLGSGRWKRDFKRSLRVLSL